MIAVIFEVLPAEGHAKDYFEAAANLKPMLEKIDGFISVERFESLANPGKYLSLSFWRDENSVKAWRNTAEHRMTQDLGRDAQLESLLRNRAKALGIEMTMGRDISQDLANSIGFGRGRGIGIGM